MDKFLKSRYDFFKRQFANPLQGTLPDNNYLPSLTKQVVLVAFIPHCILRKFGEPECCSCFRQVCQMTLFVHVPEAAVHENTGSVFG